MSWGVKYNVGSQQRRLTLGPVVDGSLKMRALASETLAKARLGTDVVAEKQAAAAKAAGEKTLGELVPVYIKAREAELREKSMREIRRYLSVTLKPLHHRPVAQIKRAEIMAVLDTMSGKPAADRCKAALSTFYGWAIVRESRHEPNLAAARAS